VPDLLVERDQPDRVLLVDHKVRQSRRETDSVIEFRKLLPVGVGHALRQVHEQVPSDIRFGLVLLDVVAVGLGEDEPVDVFEVVALGVSAVFAEFDAEPVERAGVQTAQKALDDEPGPQVEPRDRADHFRLEI
jgi:hypothetical protein